MLQENVTHRCDELVEEIISPNRQRKIVEAFDELSDTLCKVADMTEFVRLTHPSSVYSQAAEEACFNICKIVEKYVDSMKPYSRTFLIICFFFLCFLRLNTHKELYETLKRAWLKGDSIPMDEVDKHVVELFLFDFEQSGIHLDEKARQQVVYLNDCILRLGQRFMAGALTPRTVSGKSLPDSVKK